MSYEQLRRLSYFDYVLASLTNMRHVNGKCPQRHFTHFLLEYEQAIKREPSLRSEISQHFQGRIGEMAMTHDMKNDICDYFDVDFGKPPGSEKACEVLEAQYRTAKARPAGLFEIEGETIVTRQIGPALRMTTSENQIIDKIPAQVEDEDTPAPKLGVTSQQMALVRKLFSKAGDEESQGQVDWNDICTLMKRIGFCVSGIGGSIVKFIPPSEGVFPFIQHRPHPDTHIGSVRFRAFGAMLTERYDWDIDWFERAALGV
ncbi:uncharacterized protein I303_106280 [Kwoniella dejecticola CBS 10117]|uniref:Uncharacterized protein n=1 Tax=Kwoniella dejecticola CBS 10117 TaxID=1296121 RepID=A0A1A6A1T1_9TREE|nr:uncharacterized protein I303_06299 [Kwoniella dejecticola CBS 10117]OBR84012.1 hypothetical protein I303_06299 [Kwoniella dejecticola CBS 10117]